MTAILLPRPTFVREVNERIAWLARHRGEEQIGSFLIGLADVRGRIERRPEAGVPIRSSARLVVRMRLFPRPLPYLVYYAHPRIPPIDEIYLLRLYGSGQRREDFDMSEWPW